MKRCSQLAILVILLAAGSTGQAGICALDAAPAASLLFPFVVFDYNHPKDGINTLISITNMSAWPQIVHVTLWSDTAVRVLDFHVLLAGYDVQTISLRDVLHHGRLPLTGTEGALAVDGPLPIARGPVSGDNAPWLAGALPDGRSTATLAERCPPSSPRYPGHQGTSLDSDQLAAIALHLQASQAGTRLRTDCDNQLYENPGFWAEWWEQRGTDQPTWLYLTADLVYSCTDLFPDQPDYWARNGPAMYRNVLTGDVFWIDEESGFAQGDKAVHLEADREIAGMLPEQRRPATFYAPFSTGNNVQSDFREPLPTAWAVRYNGARSSAIDTYLRVWKGSIASPSPPGLSIADDGSLIADDCQGYSYWVWDEDSNTVILDECPGCRPIFPMQNLFPLAVQEVSVDEFHVPGYSGWFLFAWPNSNRVTGDGRHRTQRYQTWMGVRTSKTGRFAGAMTATVAANANCFAGEVVPGLGIDQVDIFDGSADPGAEQ